MTNRYRTSKKVRELVKLVKLGYSFIVNNDNPIKYKIKGTHPNLSNNALKYQYHFFKVFESLKALS